jgi:hypothetical protein
MNLSDIQRQVENAVDAAYRAGFEAALWALRNLRNGVDVDESDEYQAHYLDGIDDAIATLEQAQ